ncbi:taurine dioxygenase [Commensalibacter intestini A911]|uniref:Taurine dioxygenase n=1 Tax=Commensalibacter intestini A911 TaxID=1088868 RepID=G6F2N1_9PROT|nr:taurine dioxygenase [Commensalibacter intestini]EHD13140.1 taurine dioxygenase [Commensalibacter intestini A911]
MSATQPLTPAVGALINHIDLSLPLSTKDKAFIEEALLNHKVVFFRNQNISPQQQVDFASNFGNLHIHPIYPHVPNHPELIVLDTQLNDLRDNALWHSDVSFSKNPPYGAVLQAKKVPEYGGDTFWSNVEKAYDELSPALQSFLETLTATHDFSKSFPTSRFGETDENLDKLERTKRENPSITHPVIRTIPETGKKVLYVNEGFTTRINELSEKESQLLLDYLFQHITKPEFTIRWHWQAGDIAFWDNRTTQHYAVYDYDKSVHRIMNRATILK